MTKRIAKFLLLLVASWPVMTLTHESGHLVGGWIGGGTLQQVDLLPWHLPYSIFEPNPRPLLMLWGGPLLGVVAPLMAALLIRRPWMWFIAYFCLLANGAYLATAWFVDDRYLDTPRLLENGASPMTIVVYCVVTMACGYKGFRRECLRALWPHGDPAEKQSTGNGGFYRPGS